MCQVSPRATHRRCMRCTSCLLEYRLADGQFRGVRFAWTPSCGQQPHPCASILSATRLLAPHASTFLTSSSRPGSFGEFLSNPTGLVALRLAACFCREAGPVGANLTHRGVATSEFVSGSRDTMIFCWSKRAQESQHLRGVTTRNTTTDTHTHSCTHNLRYMQSRSVWNCTT